MLIEFRASSFHGYIEDLLVVANTGITYMRIM